MTWTGSLEDWDMTLPREWIDFMERVFTLPVSSSYDIWSIDMWDPVLYETGIALFFAGVLASASGIGGGGIFVAVLMLVSGMSPHQAVPLSKALIFSGSVMSFYVNVKKRDDKGNMLIDLDLVKSIVPMALSGTLFGVMMNIYTPRAVLVLCLSLLLFVMSVKTLVQGVTTYSKETQAAAARGEWVATGRSVLPATRQDVSSRHGQLIVQKDGEDASSVKSGSTVDGDSSDSCSDSSRRAENLTKGGFCGNTNTNLHLQIESNRKNSNLARDVTLLVVLLFFVIACGIARHNLPMESPSRSVVILLGAFLSLAVTFLFRSEAFRIQDDGYVRENVSSLYPLVSFVAGVCSGLMGIGGGLIFAPFLLAMKVEPQRAVCTSATCVIFTATSTTCQYLFLGRVMIYQALLFGLASFCASIFGTWFIHKVQKATGRSSYIIFIVGIAVLLSCSLTTYKGIKFAQEDWMGSQTKIISSGLALFIAKVFAATGWKFLTSMDDILWLSPFMAQSRGKLIPSVMKLILYLTVVETVVLMAACVQWSSDELQQALASSGKRVPVHAYLVLTSGSLLLCYCCFLFREWYMEKCGGAEENEEQDGEGDEDEEQISRNNMSMKRMVVVSFLGSLDEFASFTTAILGGLFSPIELATGVIFGCSGVAFICVGALQLKCIADIILGIPIWVVIGTVSIYNIINGLSDLTNGE